MGNLPHKEIPIQLNMITFGGKSKKPLSFRGNWPGLPFLRELAFRTDQIEHPLVAAPVLVELMKKGKRPGQTFPIYLIDFN